MKVTDPLRSETVIVEQQQYQPGFYIADRVGDAILPSRPEIDGPFATRDLALAVRDSRR